MSTLRVGGAGRFNDRSGRFNDRRNGAGNNGGLGGNGNMDRANRNATSNNMRDYVDPWAHNGSNSQMVGSAFGGNNGNMGSLGMTSLMSSPTNQNGNMFTGNNNNNNNLEMDGKTTTQVTIPKDVRNSLHLSSSSIFLYIQF